MGGRGGGIARSHFRPTCQEGVGAALGRCSCAKEDRAVASDAVRGQGGGATTVFVAIAAQMETEAKGGIGAGCLLMGANSLTSLIALPERAKVTLRAKETEGLVTRTPMVRMLAVGGAIEGANVEGAGDDGWGVVGRGGGDPGRAVRGAWSRRGDRSGLVIAGRYARKEVEGATLNVENEFAQVWEERVVADAKSVEEKDKLQLHVAEDEGCDGDVGGFGREGDEGVEDSAPGALEEVYAQMAGDAVGGAKDDVEEEAETAEGAVELVRGVDESHLGAMEGILLGQGGGRQLLHHEVVAVDAGLGQGGGAAETGTVGESGRAGGPRRDPVLVASCQTCPGRQVRKPPW